MAYRKWWTGLRDPANHLGVLSDRTDDFLARVRDTLGWPAVRAYCDAMAVIRSAPLVTEIRTSLTQMLRSQLREEIDTHPEDGPIMFLNCCALSIIRVVKLNAMKAGPRKAAIAELVIELLLHKQ